VDWARINRSFDRRHHQPHQQHGKDFRSAIQEYLAAAQTYVEENDPLPVLEMTFQKDAEQNEIKYLHKFADFTGKRVLEIGCGEGRLTWQYAKETRFTIGIDTDRDALRVATVDRSSDLESKVVFSCSESERLPFPKETFDIAVLAWSF